MGCMDNKPLHELKSQLLAASIASHLKYLNQSNSKFWTYRIAIPTQNA